jgi:hypothetical protein
LSRKVKSVGLAVVVSGALVLSGCGTMPGDRALSGGLLGAGGGALIGSVAGSAGKGALIGGLGGMALGALTSPDVINLGSPPWRHTAASRSRRVATARNESKCSTQVTSTQRITTCPK